MSSGSPRPMLIGMEIPNRPDCAAPIPPWGPPFCQNCRLPLTGPAAEELWHVDLTIKQLTASLTGLTAAAGLIALVGATYERRLRDHAVSATRCPKCSEPVVRPGR